eukprot:1744446-Rhodomonas_salina.1
MHCSCQQDARRLHSTGLCLAVSEKVGQCCRRVATYSGRRRATVSNLKVPGFLPRRLENRVPGYPGTQGIVTDFSGVFRRVEGEDFILELQRKDHLLSTVLVENDAAAHVLWVNDGCEPTLPQL